MSETPRTDEAWDAVSRTPDGRYSTGVPLRKYAYAMCEHSKQLERELAAAKQIMGELCESCGWAMRLPDQPCRCELERELTAMTQRRDELLASLEKVVAYLSPPPSGE